MYYYRLTKGVADKGRLISVSEDPHKYINTEEDWYASVSLYTEDQKKIFDEKGTVKGITDVVKDKLYFDFDSKDDIEKAKEDTKSLLKRLPVKADNVAIYFTGNKGFSVEVFLTSVISQSDYKSTIMHYGKGLETLDTQVLDAARILRIGGTKHPVSKLYKIPITQSELELSAEKIKSLAKDKFNTARAYILNNWSSVNIPVVKPEVKKEVARIEHSQEMLDLDFTKMPSRMDPVRYAVSKGYFESGERHIALLSLASAYKNMHWDKDDVYRMIKSAADKQARRTGTERHEDNDTWNIVSSVFSPDWKGGQFSLRDKDSWLYKYAEKLNLLKVGQKHDDNDPTLITDIVDDFKKYAKRADQNTIKTGFKQLDDLMVLECGMPLGIVGAPGSGKTSWLLDFLNTTSKAGIRSVFASLDMHRNRIFQKIMFKIANTNRTNLIETFKNDDVAREAELMELYKKNYGNVYLRDKASDVNKLRDYIMAIQDKTGENVPILVIDYFERLQSDIADDTASSKKVAAQIQDLVLEMNMLGVVLCQPNKASGDIADPILSYNNIKGSSYLAQMFRGVISMYREGYNPKNPATDNFMTFSILKNDLGETGTLDYGWNGKRGEIYELDDTQYKELQTLRENKRNNQSESDKWQKY